MITSQGVAVLRHERILIDQVRNSIRKANRDTALEKANRDTALEKETEGLLARIVGPSARPPRPGPGAAAE